MDSNPGIITRSQGRKRALRKQARRWDEYRRQCRGNRNKFRIASLLAWQVTRVTPDM